MDGDETAEAIDEAASRWVVINTGREPDAGERRAFAAWYAADPRHALVYEELMQVWHKLSAIDSTVIRTAQHRRTTRKRMMLAVGILVIGAALFQHDEIRVRTLADESTAVGEVRAVRLVDGSEVTLDADSAIAVEMSSNQRQIRLLRGRAMFDVAHDATRPFVVATNNVQATALGTRFVVATYSDHSTVTVLQSRVALRCTTCSGAVPDRVLKPRNEADVSATEVAIDDVDISEAAVRNEGMLILEAMPLSDALARLQGYTRRPIWLLDNASAKRRISAVIDPRQPDAAARTVAAAAGLQVSSVAGALFVGSPKNIFDGR
ncbi:MULTISPECIES: FecR domain-containing protein [unclassified Caballeronia]|uniref:FecR family protein n=1 Tax=unclassified Caballeronia TaxID=2646786 RepID=UPI001F265371|nr:MULTISPECIES: FecR domain-containing protein [unclassified Caballeronia]MCE4544879.1 FecR domain-containing protein [Caballeronia sp. PC1]MCE4570303.1 FecR domain-containing protein [Caballeronia sp. CLC5]